MNLDLSNRKATATVVGSAGLFAAAFWLLDAGNMLWTSNSGFFTAIIPEGSQFLVRLLYASIFAVAGSIAGAAVQRSRDIEEFAVDKLSESERKYHALLASSFDSVLTLSKDARIVELSESAAAMFGATANEMVGVAIDDLVDPESGTGPRSAQAVSTLLHETAGGRQAGTSVRARAMQGRRFPAEIRVTPMPVGGQSAYLVAIRETTSTVVAQKALRHSERRYQSLFDNIPDGVYRSLPDGRLLAANPAMVRMLGYASADDLIHCGNTREFYCDPQQRKELVGNLEQHGEARNVEIRLQRRDGSKVTALANIRAVVSENNEDVVYEGTLTDISDLLEAREALQDSEEHFRALCEHAMDVINVINTEGEILYSSPSSASLSSHDPKDQVGMKLFRSVHPDDVATVSQIIAEGFKRPGTAGRFTCRVFGDDGTLHHIDAIGTAFMTRKGDLRAVIHSRDVTERMETEAQLREMQKIQVVGRLTDGLAHEFNNVLTVLSSNIELLNDRIEDHGLKGHIMAAMEACQRGTDLTRRLMAFADRADACPENVNANALLQDMEPVLRRSLSEGISFESHYGRNLWEVSIDPVQLEGAILQLAVNAKEAMRDGGTLEISTQNHWSNESGNGLPDSPLAMDCISITIRDNGKGMNNEVLARATEPFFSTSASIGHTGLGLSAVRKFVEAAGGEIRIDSEVDAGTTIELYLPRCGASAHPGQHSDSAPCGSERVLVVDDNAAVRKATAALLGSVGYDVVEAGDGEDALRILQHESVDLLMTDLAMPNLNGLELARRAEDAHPGIKVLLTSGNEAATTGVNDDLETGYELIRKPFRRHRLAQYVRLVLET